MWKVVILTIVVSVVLESTLANLSPSPLYKKNKKLHRYFAYAQYDKEVKQERKTDSRISYSDFW